MLVAARSQTSSREESSGLYARAAALQTGSPPIERITPHRKHSTREEHSSREGGFNLIESIAPDQNGLNDHRWDVCLIGNKRRRGAGRPCPCPGSVGDTFRRLSAPPTRACAARPRRRGVSKLGQALPPPINVARNSPAISSNVESTSLELQRFRTISKSDRGEITCDICLEVVGSPPAGAVARPVSRSAPALSGPPPSAPECMSG